MFVAADVSGDNRVTSFDALTILQAAADGEAFMEGAAVRVYDGTVEV